ncbi:MAG TPA: hypothetical protein VFT53_02380 [Candidatus Saccharimonadales bacterium]|nr:hypothetical protein [Candidatus Saccharimonadales bacterium]
MTLRYKQFIFEDYRFDTTTRTLSLHYSFDGAVSFTESFRFDFDFAAYDPALLDRACQTLFFLAGVSYYKAYLAPELVIKKGAVDPETAAFFSATYERGLGEFFYVNQLDPRTKITFPATIGALEPIHSQQKSDGLLIGIGGGKDSLVSVELLRDKIDNLATWSLNHRPQLTPLVERIGLPHYWVERTFDTSLLEHNKQGAYNGHIPISAILAAVGCIVAILSGRRDVVVSNEQSANEPTLTYQGLAINHQYSKSQAFEQAFQAHIARTLGDHVRYYSLLRPLSELRIAECFAHIGYDKYADVFSSCNRAFTFDQHHMFWDGTCPKCAFIFLALTPFIPRATLEKLFSGKNLLLTPVLQPTYRQLLGIEGDKPLECVGEVKESRAAMHAAQRLYPELTQQYRFELPDSYDYTALGTHHMPPEIYAVLATRLA